ncbi:MAG: PAS domain S-box protein [Desulfococcaceae bacterium]
MPLDGVSPEIFAELARARERIQSPEAAESQRERRLLDRMEEGVLFVSPSGVIRRANPSAAALLGADSDRMAGVPISSLLGEWPADQLASAWRREPEETESGVLDIAPGAHPGSLRIRWFRDPDGFSLFLKPVVETVSEPPVLPEGFSDGWNSPYRDLLDALPVIVIVHGDHRIRFINSAGARILGGADPREFLGINLLEFVHPDAMPIVRERIRNLEKGRINPPRDIRVRLFDGQSRMLQAVSAPFSEGGRPAVLLMAVDVTDRKRAEEELTAIFQNSQAGLVLLRKGRIVNRCNRRFAEILGYENPDALRGLGVRRFHLSDDHFEEFGRLHYQTLRQGAQLQVEYPLRRKDGSAVWCSLSGKALDDGTPPDLDRGVLWVVGDVTRRKVAERAIRDSEERYRTLATHSPTGILLSDGRTIRFVNDAAARLLGADRPENLMGTALLDRIDPEYHPLALRRIQTLLEMGRPVPRVEQTYLRVDGSPMPVEVVAVPLDLAEGRLIYSLFQDITERKAAEKALRDSLREKEVLLREIHHRVKNNMAVVAGLLEMQLGRETEPGVRLLLRDSRSRIGAMSLIHETFYRSGNLAAVPLELYLRRLVDQLFSLYIERSGRVAVEIHAPDIHLSARQAVPAGLAVTELVTNAFKYAFPEGRSGALSIRGIREKSGWLALEVRDDGVGFPAHFNPETAETLGMRLLSLLVDRQLHGHWHWRSGEGVSIFLAWPDADGIAAASQGE